MLKNCLCFVCVKKMPNIPQQYVKMQVERNRVRNDNSLAPYVYRKCSVCEHGSVYMLVCRDCGYNRCERCVVGSSGLKVSNEVKNGLRSVIRVAVCQRCSSKEDIIVDVIEESFNNR